MTGEEDIVVDKDLFLINAETGSLYFAMLKFQL